MNTKDATARPWMWGWRDDEAAPASIFSMSRPGHAYAVAMCPRYQKPEQWVADAKLIVDAVNSHDALLARIASLTKALEVARSAIWSGFDTIAATAAIDAALNPTAEDAA